MLKHEVIVDHRDDLRLTEAILTDEVASPKPFGDFTPQPNRSVLCDGPDRSEKPFQTAFSAKALLKNLPRDCRPPRDLVACHEVAHFDSQNRRPDIRLVDVPNGTENGIGLSGRSDDPAHGAPGERLALRLRPRPSCPAESGS